MTIGSAFAPAGRLDLAPTASGPLDGVRVAVKDLIDVAGTVTAAGNPTLAAGPPAADDAAVVAALRAAGATIVAKTATDELAMGMFGVNAHYGTPPNPAAPERVPGGSSSGSASLVASGDADLGVGTDTGGSVRSPAAFCGLVGLRPTHGRISLSGVRPMASGFDTVGFLGQTVDVVGRAFGAASDPSAAGARPVRALVVLDDLVERADPEAAARTEATASRWAEALEVEVRHDVLADHAVPDDLLSVFWPLMSRQLWEVNGAWVTEERPVLGEGIAERIAAAAEVDDGAVAEAERGRAALQVRLRELLRDAVAVLPTAIGPAPLRATPHAALMAWRDRNLPLVVPASLTGAPQLSLPAGTVAAEEGAAPVGVSLLGLPGDDELLVDLAGRLAGEGPRG